MQITHPPQIRLGTDFETVCLTARNEPCFFALAYPNGELATVTFTRQEMAEFRPRQTVGEVAQNNSQVTLEEIKRLERLLLTGKNEAGVPIGEHDRPRILKKIEQFRERVGRLSFVAIYPNLPLLSAPKSL